MFQFFHICDHRLRSRNKEPLLREIEIKNDGTATDVVIDGGIVASIEAVRAITFRERVTKDEFLYDNVSDDQRYEDKDAEDGFYDGAENFFIDYSRFVPKGSGVSDPLPKEFYEPFLHNRIKWLVEPPLSYIVEARVLFSNRKVESYSLLDCPQCQGKGWFTDILNAKGVFVEEEGAMKIAQNVIKDLLTELQTSVLNLQYGTLLKKAVAGSSKEDEAVFDDIRMIVSEVEDRYLLRQQLEYDRISPGERLVKLWANDISRSPKDFRKFVIELQIQTEEEEQTFRFSL